MPAVPAVRASRTTAPARAGAVACRGFAGLVGLAAHTDARLGARLGRACRTGKHRTLLFPSFTAEGSGIRSGDRCSARTPKSSSAMRVGCRSRSSTAASSRRHSLRGSPRMAFADGVRCRPIAHRLRFWSDGGTMRRKCRCGCGAGGSQRYAPEQDAARYTRAFDREERDDFGKRTPLLGLVPLRLARALSRRRRQS